MKLEPGEVIVAQMPDGDRPLVDWRELVRDVATGEGDRPDWIVALDPHKPTVRNLDAAFDGAVRDAMEAGRHPATCECGKCWPMTTAIEAARAALSRAMEGSDRTAVTEAARRLGFVEGVEAAAQVVHLSPELRDDQLSDYGRISRRHANRIRALATGAGDAAEERGDA